ncbi:MAG: hypothetical protein ACI4PT_09790 [Candidatus Avoscillospira sp.]
MCRNKFRFATTSGEFVTLLHLIRRFAPPSPQGEGFGLLQTDTARQIPTYPAEKPSWRLRAGAVFFTGFCKFGGKRPGFWDIKSDYGNHFFGFAEKSIPIADLGKDGIIKEIPVFTACFQMCKTLWKVWTTDAGNCAFTNYGQLYISRNSFKKFNSYPAPLPGRGISPISKIFPLTNQLFHDKIIAGKQELYLLV